MEFIIWLLFGFIGYVYFGIKTKWIGRKYNTKFDDCVEIIVCTLCGFYTFLCVTKSHNFS